MDIVLGQWVGVASRSYWLCLLALCVLLSSCHWNDSSNRTETGGEWADSPLPTDIDLPLAPGINLEDVAVNAQTISVRRPVWRTSLRDPEDPTEALSELGKQQKFDLRVRFAWRLPDQYCNDEHDESPSTRVTQIVEEGAELDLVLIADDRYFDVPEDSRHQRIVVRGEMPNDTCDHDGEDADPAIAAAAAHFNITSKQRAGPGGATVIVYRNGRPVDNIALSICVGCGGDVLIKSGEKLDDYITDLLNDVAAEPETDASLFVFDFSESARGGVLSLRLGPGSYRYYPWINSTGDIGKTRDILANTYAAVLSTETDHIKLERKAELMTRVIFGNGGEAARKALEAFLVAPRPATAQVPSLFVRVSSRSNPEPLVFPFGFVPIRNITDGTGFVGLHARVMVPMLNQHYETSDACPGKVMAVLPNVNQNDSALKQARQFMGDDVGERWWSASMDGFRWSSTRKFEDWLISSPELDEPVALFVLTHHHNGSLWIDRSETVEPDAVGKNLFGEPSWVVLNGCSTASNPMTAGFASKLNEGGAQAVITTLYEVEATLAGAYFQCLDEALSQATDETRYDLGQAHFEATQCLWKKSPTTTGIPAEGATKWGPNALKYTLLGNPNLRVCPIKEIL